MPQAEIKYSADLTFDAAALLADIEQVIQARDSGAGACKGRAYPAEAYCHSHFLCSVRLLDKPHRDAVFMQGLLEALSAKLKPALPKGTKFGIEVSFLPPHYITETLGH